VKPERREGPEARKKFGRVPQASLVRPDFCGFVLICRHCDRNLKTCPPVNVATMATLSWHALACVDSTEQTQCFSRQKSISEGVHRYRSGLPASFVDRNKTNTDCVKGVQVSERLDS
jgi:hypothetical protein